MVLLIVKFGLCGVVHTAESNFSKFVIKYLGEIETEFENTLHCLSWVQWVRIMEKSRGRKSRDTLPLSCIVDQFCNSSEYYPYLQVEPHFC